MLYNPLETTGFFEGSEKVLKIFLNCHNPSCGLRNIPRNVIDKFLDCVNAKIVGGSKNKYCDSYVLSESSLFIFENKMIIKTCGTTSLLLALSEIIDSVYDHTKCSIDKLIYSRKSYLKSENQLYPHQNYDQEFEFIKTFFPTCEKFTYGDKDDWSLIYYKNNAQKLSNLSSKYDCTFEIMMNDLDKKSSNCFLFNNYPSGELMSEAAEFYQLIPGAFIDSYAFDPIGYSMNGILKNIYETVHVTPQYSCSYASFETNIIEKKDLIPIIKKLLQKFSPQQFIITVFNMNCFHEDIEYKETILSLGYVSSSVQSTAIYNNQLQYLKFIKA